MSLRVAMVGAGNIATSHVTGLRALGNRVDLVAVCDRDRDKGEAFRKSWGIPEFFEDLDAMIGQTRPDVVHVLLPPAAHSSAAIDCLDRGCHIFVEKPFCLTSEECHRVIRAGETNCKRVGVNHNLTYMPAILKLIDQIRHRQLGAVQHVTVMYNLPIAALDAGIHSHWMFGKPERILMELGPHPLSVIHRLLGPVQAGAASVAGKRILKHGGVFYDTWQTSLVCDRGTAQMVVAAGGEFLSTWVYVLGQDGEAFVDLRRNTIRVSGNSPYLRTAGLRDGFRNGGALIRQSLGNFIAQTKGSLGLARAYELQTFSMNDSIRAFYAALLTDAKLPVDGADGAAVVRACEIVTQSALQFVEKGATPVGSI